MSGHHPISDLLATGKVNPERLSDTANIIEVTLELQKLMVNNNDQEKIKLVQNKLAEMIFAADLETLTGTAECLMKMVKNTIPDKA